MIYFDKLKNKRFRTILEAVENKYNFKIPQIVFDETNLVYENGVIKLVNKHDENNFITIDLTDLGNYTLQEGLQTLLGDEPIKPLTQFEDTVQSYFSLIDDDQLFEDSIDIHDQLISEDELTITLPDINEYMDNVGINSINLDLPLYLFMKTEDGVPHIYTAIYDSVDIISLISNEMGQVPVFNTNISSDDVLELI